MKTRIFCLSALALALSACAGTPPANNALDLATGRYNAAQNDQQVASLATEELKQADDALRVAKTAWKNRDETSDINHLAYLANRRITIAQETAASRGAQAITAGAGAARDKTRLAQRTEELAQRTDEVDQANQRLAQSQQSNARKTEALATADQKLARSEQINAEQSADLAAADAIASRNSDEIERSNARANDLESQLKDLNAKKTDRGMVVTLGDVLFNSGKAQVLPGSAGNLNKLAAFFKRNPERTATVEGYTDSVGAASANYTLSQQRATAVMTALVNLGVPAASLSTRAHGADSPIASNGTAAGRQMNRRVEIVFAQPAN